MPRRQLGSDRRVSISPLPSPAPSAAIGDLLNSETDAWSRRLNRRVFAAFLMPRITPCSKHGLLGIDAQPRRRICEDQPDRERGLPGLCRHADDRSVHRPGDRKDRPQRRASPARHHHQHECERPAGRPTGDRQDLSQRSVMPLSARHQRRSRSPSMAGPTHDLRSGKLVPTPLPVELPKTASERSP